MWPLLINSVAVSKEFSFLEIFSKNSFSWNFLFISGTSLLVLCYREEEKFRAQGYNDLIVYSIQAVASLSAGVFLSLTSWKTMNLICLIFLIIIALSTIRADLKKNPSN